MRLCWNKKVKGNDGEQKTSRKTGTHKTADCCDHVMGGDELLLFSACEFLQHIEIVRRVDTYAAET